MAGVTEADLVGLYPMPVQACIARAGMEEAPLTPEEAASIAGAAPARRREYTLGRAALRVALHRLGATGVSAPARADRSPALPAGYAASLSHCPGFCAAVAARGRDVDALGFDAEPAQPLPDDLADLVSTALDDRETWRGGPASQLWPTLVFSAKEAVYKCQWPLAAVPLDFPDLGLRFHSPEGDRGRFTVRLRPAAPPALRARGWDGSWRVAGGLILSAAWPAPPTVAPRG